MPVLVHAIVPVLALELCLQWCYDGRTIGLVPGANEGSLPSASRDATKVFSLSFDTLSKPLAAPSLAKDEWLKRIRNFVSGL